MIQQFIFFFQFPIFLILSVEHFLVRLTQTFFCNLLSCKIFSLLKLISLLHFTFNTDLVIVLREIWIRVFYLSNTEKRSQVSAFKQYDTLV